MVTSYSGKRWRPIKLYIGGTSVKNQLNIHGTAVEIQKFAKIKHSCIRFRL